MEDLQTHQNEALYMRVVHLLETYFGAEDGEDDDFNNDVNELVNEQTHYDVNGNVTVNVNNGGIANQNQQYQFGTPQAPQFGGVAQNQPPQPPNQQQYQFGAPQPPNGNGNAPGQGFNFQN